MNEIKDKEKLLGHMWINKKRNGKCLSIWVSRGMVAKRKEDLETNNLLIVQILLKILKFLLAL